MCVSRQRISLYYSVQDNAFNYDKGVLAEILEPIMGKGLIPADLETWKPRRRAIVPAFHKAYLDAMVAMFGKCTQETIRSLDALTDGNPQVPLGAHAWHVRCAALKFAALLYKHV